MTIYVAIVVSIVSLTPSMTDDSKEDDPECPTTA